LYYDRHLPLILYIGAAILGKIGGELIIIDPAVQTLLDPSEFATLAFVLVSAVSVVTIGRSVQVAKSR